jgi:hypothetical protein
MRRRRAMLASAVFGSALPQSIVVRADRVIE